MWHQTTHHVKQKKPEHQGRGIEKANSQDENHQAHMCVLQLDLRREKLNY